MLLTVDVGNTNITMGIYSGDELVCTFRLATDRARTADQYAVELLNVFSLYGIKGDFEGAAVSCVVPEISRHLAGALEKVTGHKPLILGPGVKTGMNIIIDDPAQVGADLVAGGVGAAALYPLPCLVIDLGTATKISLIDKNGAFRGCAISPGIGISLDALSARTSQLPAISLNTPPHAVGTNTVDSMQSGIVFGTAAMLDGMCNKIEEELGTPVATVVATGGYSRDIVRACRREIVQNSDLILYGLKVIFEKNERNR